ncbi:MAG TPA: 50S ribosomal protein L9, partial [Armatimonadetes bacterium]|nr:50S ribosomal protein L9 [Armatimonadota bacterium]
MKVILMRDVPKVGSRLDVVEVANGYARNYLILRGLAIRATPSALRQREHELTMLQR